MTVQQTRTRQTSFVVASGGIKPSPQGSKKNHAARNAAGEYTGRVVSRESAKDLKAYRAAIMWAAAAARRRAGLAEPLAADLTVLIVINFRRPARTQAASPVAPSFGDVDKLARAALDALKDGGLIADDRYVTSLLVSKHFGDAHATEITVLWEEDAEPEPDP